MDTLIGGSEKGAISLERYVPEMAGQWNRFVAESRNGTFLFKREYMDYHSDRFADHSLIARRRGETVALLPANERRESDGSLILQSHGGLTYGGWILLPRHRDESDMLELFGALRRYAGEMGIRSLDYKPVPHIYCSIPSDDDVYALFREGARLTECNVSACINLRCNPGFNTQQRRNLKKGVSAGVRIEADVSTCRLHALLSECLAERHEATPVHNMQELEMLRGRFSQEIRHFMAVGASGQDLAGVCMYDTGRVAHAQYICSNAEGRAIGALTYLFRYLIEEEYAGCEYFDFGTCNEDSGRYLNAGLFRQKSGLGGSAVAYQRYRIDYVD